MPSLSCLSPEVTPAFFRVDGQSLRRCQVGLRVRCVHGELEGICFDGCLMAVASGALPTQRDVPRSLALFECLGIALRASCSRPDLVHHDGMAHCLAR